MEKSDLQTIVFNDANRIVHAIQSGAGWEIWLQVELAILFKEIPNFSVAREVPYEPPYQSMKLDLLLRDATMKCYAIELKVESATNAGSAILGALAQDRAKLSYYPPGPATRWILALVYSSEAINKLAAYAERPENAAEFKIQHGLGVLVATV